MDTLLVALEKGLYIARSVKHTDDYDPIIGRPVEDEVVPESGHGPAADPLKLTDLIAARGARLWTGCDEVVRLLHRAKEP